MTTKFRTFHRQGYIPFPSDKLIVGTRLPFDVYMKEDGIHVAVFVAGTDYTKLSQNFLIDRGLN